MNATSTWRRRALAALAAAGTTGALAAAAIATPVGAMPAPHAAAPHAVEQAAGSYCLYAGQTLTSGQDIIWQNLEVVMGSDGNLVMVDLVDGSHAVWANGATGHPGAYLIMQGDGNLVEYYQGRAVWNTGTYNHPGAYACVSPWAGFYVYYQGTTFLWHTPVWGFLDTTRNGGTITSDLFAGQSLTGANGSEIDDYEQGYTVYQYGGYLQLRLRSNGQLLQDAGASCGGTSIATMQSDGNFVIKCNGNVIASTNTGGHPASYGYYLHLQSCDYSSGEGNGVDLKVISNYGQTEWSWNTCGLT